MKSFLLFHNRTLWVRESLDKAKILVASSGGLCNYFDGIERACSILQMLNNQPYTKPEKCLSKKAL